MIRRPMEIAVARIGVVVAVSLLAACSSLSSESLGSRPATSNEKQRIAAEVRLTLRFLADSPGTGIHHGTGVLLAPICTSTVDSRYAVAVVTPFVRTGMGQPGRVFLRRVPRGYRVVGGLRIGEDVGRRPVEVPRPAFVDLYRPRCSALSPREVRRLRSKRLAPYFVI